MTTSIHDYQLKRSRFLSLLMRFSVYQTQDTSLGVSITFVNNFPFNYLCSVCVFYFCIFRNKLDFFEATCFIILLTLMYHNLAGIGEGSILSPGIGKIKLHFL
jgi:hypothetical protein